ncbi:MAG: hypothetical protein ABFD69_08440 [Candidatus Sumerlaeia bacterium]
MPARTTARSSRREAALRPAIGLLGLLWLGVGLVPAMGTFARPYADLRWLFVIAGLLGVVALMANAERKGDARFSLGGLLCDPAALGAVLIGAGLVVSSLASPNPMLGLRIAARECFLVGAAWCLSRWSPNRREQVWLVGCLVGAVALQAGLGLVQAWAGPAARSAIHGTMEQSEALADFVGCGAAAAAIAALGSSRNRIAFWACLVVAVVGAAVIFVSGGRGGALAGGAALAVALVARRGSFKAAWLAWGAGILVVFAGLYLALPGHRAGTLFHRLGEIANPESVPTRHRIGLVTISSHMVLDRPFAGAGPGRFAAAFSAMQGRLAETEKGTGFWSFNEMTSRLTPGEAHCDPLQWWAEYGLLACLGLLLMVTSAAIGGASGENEPWRAALWTAFIAMAIVMWVSYPLHDPMRALFFWSLLGFSGSRVSTDNQFD